MSAPRSSGNHGPTRILVCDDNAAVREMICIILDETDGLQVVGQAADGYEAVAEAIRLRPDVIVLDLAMPQRSGLDALPELQTHVPDAKVIVLTGFASRIVSEAVLALGALRLVEKGTRPSVIVDTVLDVIGAGAAPGSDLPAA